MDKLPDEILIYTFKFLNNEDIYNVSYLCKLYYKLLTTKFFINYMNNRYHPVIFNILDNFCNLCNRGLVFIELKDDFNIDRCYHHYFKD